MALDGRILYFTRAATIRQSSEVLLKKMRCERNKGEEEREQGMKIRNKPFTV
jgi:hypothetical protein